MAVATLIEQAEMISIEIDDFMQRIETAHRLPGGHYINGAELEACRQAVFTAAAQMMHIANGDRSDRLKEAET